MSSNTQQEYNYVPLCESIPIRDQVWLEGTLPLVSISSIAFNHEPYIRECLEGFLMQRTTFPVEILLHDDASTDKTGDIIREYEVKYRDIIKPIYQTENQFSKGVPISATFNWSRAKGKYIALCEGDDYWTYPLKLQKQVEFMEMHPEVPFCCHRFKILKQEQGHICKEYAHKYYGKGDLIIDIPLFSKVWVTQPLTALIRKDALERAVCEIEGKGYPEHRDVYLFYSLLKQGNGVSLNQNMGVYRLHKAGISGTDRRKKFAKSYEMYKAISSKNPDDIHIRRKLVRQIIGILAFDKKLSPHKYHYLKEGLGLASCFMDKMELWCAFFVPKWMKR